MFHVVMPGAIAARASHQPFIAINQSIVRQRCTPASRWRLRASMRWIRQCMPTQWIVAPLS